MTTAKKSAAKKAPASKSSETKSTAKKSSAKKAATKKAPVKQSSKKSGAETCWPGFKSVPGKKPGTKGSCEPKDKQTAGEKKADSKAAAASKQKKS